jgi:hypothetical protein
LGGHIDDIQLLISADQVRNVLKAEFRIRDTPAETGEPSFTLGYDDRFTSWSEEQTGRGNTGELLVRV